MGRQFGAAWCHTTPRAKAITDKEMREGMRAARLMGAHATESQTADDVRQKAARKTRATR